MSPLAPRARSSQSTAGLLAGLLLLPVLIAVSGCMVGLSSDGRLMLSSLFDVLASRSTDCQAEGTPADATLQQMFDNLNAYRAQNGLPPLRYSTNLEAAASAHAEDMYARNFFDHRSPDGDGPYERSQAAGYCAAVAVGENLALTHSADPLEAQLGWQGSPGHDANMRSPMWAYVGMGHYEAPAATAQVIVPLTPEQLADFLLGTSQGQPPTSQPAPGGSTSKANYWVQLFGGP